MSKDEPICIINDMGELGVFVNGRAFFLYKGDNIEYDTGPSVKYRRVHKREFGECQHSEAQQLAGQRNGGDFYEAEAAENRDGLWVTEGTPPPTYRGPDFIAYTRRS